MNRFVSLQAVLASIVLGVGLLWPADDAMAQQRPPPPPTGATRPVATPAPAAPAAAGPVSVQVMCVRGTKSNDRVDPELKPMLKQLAFIDYTGFDLLSDSTVSLAVGADSTFAIEGGRKVKVELLDRDDMVARLRVRMFNSEGEKALDTTVSVHRNRSFMVAGPRVGDDVLIMPITVTY